MSKDSKHTTDSRNVQLPKAPDYVRNGVEGLTGAILNLGNTNAQQYVPGASGLQSQAFGGASSLASRYFGGGSPQPYMQGGNGQPMSVGGGGGGNGLFAQLGVNNPATPNYDWDAIGADRAAREPGFVQGFNSLTEQNHRDIAELLGSPDQRINQGQYAQYMRDYDQPWSPEMEARFAGLSGGNGKTSNPFSTTGVTQPGQTYGGGGGLQGPNPLDMYGDAANIARGVAGAGPQTADYSGVMDLLRGNSPSASAGSVQAASLLDGLQNYMSPYTNDVVDTTLANVDEYDARQLAQSQGEAAGNGAFGGSRYGVMDAILRGEQGRNRSATEATLRDQAFNTGAALSGQDADRRQSASSTNAQLATQVSMANAQSDLSRLLTGANLMFQGIGNNQQAAESGLDRSLRAGDSLRTTGAQQSQDERSALGLLGELGAQERQINQQQANADLGLLSTITQLFGGIPFDQVTGIVSNGNQTTTHSPGLLDWINGGANVLGAINQG